MGITFNPLSGEFDYTGAGLTVIPKYTQAFNSTTDWGVASGGFYYITVLAATHGAPSIAEVTVFETSGTDVIKIEVDEVKVDTTNNVTIRVPSSPDLRFAGKILIL